MRESGAIALTLPRESHVVVASHGFRDGGRMAGFSPTVPNRMDSVFPEMGMARPFLRTVALPRMVVKVH